MDEFLKKIRISFEINDNDVKNIQKILNDFQKNGNVDAINFDTDEANTLRDLLNQINEQTSKSTKDTYDTIKNARKNIRDDEQKIFNDTFSDEFSEQIQNEIDNLRKLAKEIETTKKLLEELGEVQSENAEKATESLKTHLSELEKEYEKLYGTIESDNDHETDSNKSKSNFFSDVQLSSGLLSSIKSGGKAGLAAWGAQTLVDIGQKFLDGLKNVFSNAVEEFDTMLSYSQMTNESIREQAYTYGLSQSENYALSKSLDFLGVSSIDDLMLGGTNQQRLQFQEKYLEYQKKYADLYDSGFFDEYQEFQWEMQEFKEDLMYEMMEWMMDNKETVMTLLQTLADFAQFTIEALGWLVKYFGAGSGERSDSTRTATTTDIINSHSVTNTSSTNVKIDNTFNNVAKQDTEWLAHAGEMTYEQVITALK